MALKVLLAHVAYQIRGGEDVVVDQELQLLAEAGYEVDALILKNDAISGIAAIIRAAVHVADNADGIAALVARIRAFKPDIVHFHNTFPLLSPAALGAARAEGVAVVQTLHNFRNICVGALLLRDGRPCETCVSGSVLNGVLHRCYRGSAIGSAALAHMIATHRRRGTWHSDVDRFVVLSQFQRDVLIRAGFPGDKMSIKGNFAADPGPSGPRQREGLLYVGRLSEEKGAHILIEAAQRCQVPLTIVGAGPLSDTLRSHAPPHVTFAGALPREAVAERMAGAIGVVIPSICYEGFPMTLAESFAVATPVIASRLGSLGELVEDGRTGRLVAAGDPEALAAAMTAMAADPAAAQALGAAARAQFLSAFTPQASITAFQSIYAEALAARHSR